MRFNFIRHVFLLIGLWLSCWLHYFNSDQLWPILCFEIKFYTRFSLTKRTRKVLHCQKLLVMNEFSRTNLRLSLQRQQSMQEDEKCILNEQWKRNFNSSSQYPSSTSINTGGSSHSSYASSLSFAAYQSDRPSGMGLFYHTPQIIHVSYKIENFFCNILRKKIFFSIHNN